MLAAVLAVAMAGPKNLAQSAMKIVLQIVLSVVLTSLATNAANTVQMIAPSVVLVAARKKFVLQASRGKYKLQRQTIIGDLYALATTLLYQSPTVFPEAISIIE